MLESEEELGGGQEQSRGEFDTFLDDMAARQRQSLNLSDHLASKIPQDQAAQSLRLSTMTGQPVETVFRDLNGFKAEQSKLTDAEKEQLFRDAPQTAKWATEPFRRAAVKDDTQRLAEIEKTLRSIAEPKYRQFTDEELRPLVERAQKERAAKDFPAQQEALEAMKIEEEAGLPPLRPRTNYPTQQAMEEGYIKEATQALKKKMQFLEGDTSKTSWLERAGLAMTTGFEQGGLTQELGRLGTQRMIGDRSPGTAQAIERVKAQIGQNPKGQDFASRWILPGSKIVGQMYDSVERSLERATQGALFGGAAGAMAGPASTLTAPTGMIQGFNLGMKQGMTEQAFITEAGNAYVELDEITGKNGEKLDEGVKRAAAASVGTINATLEMIGLHFLSAPMKAVAKRWVLDGVKDTIVKPTVKRAILGAGKEYIKSVGGEVGTEFMQEGVNVLAEELSKMASKGEFEKASSAEVVERLAGIVSETFRGTAVLGLPGSTINLAHDVRRARHTQEALKTIQKVYDTLKLAQTNPEEIEAVAKASAAEAGIPFMTVKAKPLAEYYQSKGVDAADRFAQLTGSSAGFAEAVQANGDVQIPTEKYVTMSPEEKTFLQGEIRRDPLDMSPNDTEALIKEEQAKVAEQQKAEQLRAEQEARDVERVARQQKVRESTARVLDELENAVAAAGFKKEAATIARGLTQFFRVLGQRENIDPYDLFSERPITIERRGDLPVDAEGQVYEQRKPGQLTGAERRFFDEVYANEADKTELLEAVPSIRYENGKLSIEAKDREAFTNYIDDTYRLREGRALPPSFYTPAFSKFVTVRDEGNAGVFEQPGENANEPRGRIRIGKSKIDIDVLAKGDVTTVMHEFGHAYLDILERLASRKEASAQIKADWQTVREWMGLKEGEALEEKHHEQWAEGWERYLMEGKAPSKALRGAFYRFKQWLSDVYQGMKEALGFELNDDVRKVMDRLLATDEEILQAQFDQAQQPLFEDAKAAGATDTQAARYAELTIQARQLAEEKLLTKAMEQARREQEEWYEKERGKVRGEVEGQVNQEPVYRAVSVLQTGKLPDGTELPPQAFAPGLKSLKIDRASIAPLFGEQYSDIDVKTLPRNITAKEGGLHADIVAGMFGFQSGREMISALQGMEDKEARIDRLTDERMQAEYGGPPTEAEIKEAALASIHNDARAEQIILEMQILTAGDKGLTKLIAGQIPKIAEVRKRVEKTIGGQTLRTINPRLYLAAERRAAKAALDLHLNGKTAEAIREKQNEIVNHESFRVAEEAKEDVADSLERWKVLQKSDEKLAKTRDMDYVNAARAALARVNVGKSDKSASSYLEPIKKYDPQLYEDMRALVEEAVPEANRELKDLTYDEFKALKTAIDALIAKSARSQQLTIEGKVLNREEVQNKLVAVMDKIEPAQKAKATKSEVGKIMGALLQGKAMLSRVEHWADALGKEFMQVFPDKVHEATTNYRAFLDDWLNRYKAVLEKLPPLKDGEIYSPELDFTFKNKKELLGALLHTGNAEDSGSNLWKLLLGRSDTEKGTGWAKLNEDGTLDASKWQSFIQRMWEKGILTKADYDYVQRVWDMFDEIKPLLQKTHKDLNGYYFSEITATPFHTPFGDYKGGYFPALADPNEVAMAAVRGEKAEAEVGNSFSLPTAGTGRTKKRSKAYWKPLRMDLDAVPEHIKWAGRYINIEPHVAELRRLLWSNDFRDRLDQFSPEAAGSMLMPWLQRTATQTVEAPMKSKILRAAGRWIRQVAGAKQLGLNVINAAQNAEGLFVAMTKVDGEHLLGSMRDYFTHPFATHERIAKLSQYMKYRTQEVIGSLQDTANEILHDPTLFQDVKRFTNKHVFFLSKFTQGIVDDVVWLAAFNEAVAKNPTMTEEAAAKAADSVVRLTQGSSAPEDISAFEAGNAWTRLLTMYTSWFNMRANLLGSEGAKIMRSEMGLPKKAARLSVLAATGFMVPAFVGAGLMAVLSGKKLDEDDDGYLDDFLAFFFGSQWKEAKAMMPGVGPMLDSMANQFDKNPNNDRLNVSPGVQTLERLLGTPASIKHALVDETEHGEPYKGAKGKAIEDVLTAVSAITGVPVSAVGKQARYAVDVAEGAKEPSGPFDFLRGMVTGSGSAPEKKKR